MSRNSWIRDYFAERQGAAAVEFALMLSVFTAGLPSVIDLGIYAYDNMQVKNSAQMAVQAVWAACTQMPVTDTASCSNAQSSMTTGAQQTSLGTNVTVSSVTESYSCAKTDGTLVNAASNGKTGNFTTALDTNVSPAPTSCPSGSATSTPGDYISATVTYTYSPVFAHISVASLLSTTITGTATMRLQ
jgi:Flp pilus assembly protein TadG